MLQGQTDAQLDDRMDAASRYNSNTSGIVTICATSLWRQQQQLTSTLGRAFAFCSPDGTSDALYLSAWLADVVSNGEQRS